MVRLKIEIDEKLISDFKNYITYASDSSIRVYALNITNIAKGLGKPISVETFSDFTAVKDYLESLKSSTSTTKNKVAAIVNYIKMNKVDKEVIEKYSNYLESLCVIVSEVDKNIKNPKEGENWLTKEQLDELAKSLKVDLPKTCNDYKDIEKWMKYIVLNYHITYPLRNELADAKILTKSKFKENDESINYFIVEPKTKSIEMILQNFKTAKTYGAVDFTINDKMSREIIKYYTILKKYKRDNNIVNDWLVITSNGEKLSRNNYTSFINSIFNPLGKKIGASMIRKIIVSSVYDVKKMNELAYIMCHSKEMAMNTYAKL